VQALRAWDAAAELAADDGRTAALTAPQFADLAFE